MGEEAFRKLVYDQFTSLTIATSALARAIASIHLGQDDGVKAALKEAMAELSEALGRLEEFPGSNE